jgi:hypothetical protein
MKSFTIQVAAVIALLGMGTTAFAADSAMSTSAMSSASMTTASMATLLCRPAASGEKAMATSADNTPLICKKIDMPEMMDLKAKIQAMPGGEPIWLKMFQDFHIDSR